MVLHGGHGRGHDQSALFSPESLSFASDFDHNSDLSIIISFQDQSYSGGMSSKRAP